MHHAAFLFANVSVKDLGRLYRFSAQSFIVSGSFCVNLIEYLLLSP